MVHSWANGRTQYITNRLFTVHSMAETFQINPYLKSDEIFFWETFLELTRKNF